jgi:spore germination cell wall hydrolase CwlJ-like protein
MPLSDNDRDLLARTMLSEAGIDGDDGMKAVAAVIKNRVNSDAFPNSIADVIHQPGQFSAWGLPRTDPNNPNNFGKKNPNMLRAGAIADSVFAGQGPDPTNAATYYANIPIVKANLRPGQKMPPFTQYPQTAQIGHHTFFSPDGGNSQSAIRSAINPPNSMDAIRSAIGSMDTAQ